MRQDEAARAYEARIAALEAKIRDFEASLSAAPPAAAAPRRDLTGWAERWGLLVAWALLILVIGAFKPDQMFAWRSYASMFGSNAMIVVLTLGLMIPLTTGDFDLSVASTMGLSSMLIAVLNVQMDWTVTGAGFVALLIGGAIGAVNAFFILWFGSL